jgi:excisionase family DNA binding protein
MHRLAKLRATIATRNHAVISKAFQRFSQREENMPTATEQLPRAVTPGEYADRLGVSVDKVRTWIEQGELFALNVATSAHGKKPRWRIPLDAIERFEDGRGTKPAPPVPKRRRRRDANIIEFF